MRYCYCGAKVHCSSVSVVYVVCEGTLQKRGSMEPIEPPLDPPLITTSMYTKNCVASPSFSLYGRHNCQLPQVLTY